MEWMPSGLAIDLHLPKRTALPRLLLHVLSNRARPRVCCDSTGQFACSRAPEIPTCKDPPFISMSNTGELPIRNL